MLHRLQGDVTSELVFVNFEVAVDVTRTLGKAQDDTPMVSMFPHPDENVNKIH